MDAEPFWKDAAAWVVATGVLLCSAFLAWLVRWAWVKLDGKADRLELSNHMEEDTRRFEVYAAEARESRHALRNDVQAAQLNQTALNLEIKSELGNVTGQLEQLTQAVRAISQQR